MRLTGEGVRPYGIRARGRLSHCYMADGVTVKQDSQD